MRAALVLLAASALVAACSSGTTEPSGQGGPKTADTNARRPEASCTRVGGSRAELTIPIGALYERGPQIDEPLSCGDGFYVRVHGRGKRRIDYDTRPSPSDPCTGPGVTPASACATVSVHVLGLAIAEAVALRLGALSGGFGLGQCGRVQEPLSKWNVSTYINDWRLADEAVRVVDGELRRWDVDGEFGVSLRPVLCAIPL